MIELLLNETVSQEDVLRKYNANITFMYLPFDIKGFVYCYRGVNNIFVNENLPLAVKKKVILHELAHIELNHLQQRKECLNFNLRKIEDEADEYIKLIYNS